MMFDGCLRLPFQAGVPECATGDTASKTTVAVVGDSHSSMWIPAFQQVGKQRPWRIETMAKAACPMMDLPVANRYVSPSLNTLNTASNGAVRSWTGYALSTRSWSW